MYLQHLMQLAWLVCSTSFIQYKVQANESNLAKFTSIDCLSIDPEYISNTSCRVKAARRDLYLINISIMIKKPVDKLVVRIKLFKKANTFMPFLIDAKENLCEFLLRKHVSMYMKVLGSIYLPYSNVNSSCPLMGEQIFKDMPLDGKLLPSIWPTGEYRLDIFIYRIERLLIIMRFNFALEEKIRRKP